MSEEQDRWEFAARLLETHPDDSAIYLVRCIREARDNDDANAVAFWFDIAGKALRLAGPDEGGWTQ